MTETRGYGCATCPFYVAADERQGTCHAGPGPHAMPILMPPNQLSGGQPILQVRSAWPPVTADDWCGHHPLFALQRAVPIHPRLADEAEGKSVKPERSITHVRQ